MVSILHTRDLCLSFSSEVPGAFHPDPFAQPLMITSALPSDGRNSRLPLLVAGSGDSGNVFDTSGFDRGNGIGERCTRGSLSLYGGGMDSGISSAQIQMLTSYSLQSLPERSLRLLHNHSMPVSAFRYVNSIRWNGLDTTNDDVVDVDWLEQSRK